MCAAVSCTVSEKCTNISSSYEAAGSNKDQTKLITKAFSVE